MKHIYTLFLFLSSILLANQVDRYSFFHLDPSKNINSQIEEHSNIYSKYYYGMDKNKIINKDDFIIKNPCSIGTCGLNETIGYSIVKNDKTKYNGIEYSILYKFNKNNKLNSIKLIRNIERKNYQFNKYRQNTVFSFFEKNSNLLQEKKNTNYVLKHCSNGNTFLDPYSSKNVAEFYTKCEKMYKQSFKKRTFDISQTLYNNFFIRDRKNLSKSTLQKLIQNKEMPLPYKKEVNISLKCSGFGYCVEVVTFNNISGKLINEKYMVYKNRLIERDLSLLEDIEKERSLFTCNSDINEIGITKNEYLDRNDCKLRKDTFEENIFYVLKSNKLNSQDKDIADDFEYINFYKKIQELKDEINVLYNNITIEEGVVKKKTIDKLHKIKLILNEYTYLLSLINVHNPIVIKDLFKYNNKDLLDEKRFSENELNNQIEHSLNLLNKYKLEKYQYKMNVEHSRIEFFKLIKRLKGFY